LLEDQVLCSVSDKGAKDHHEDHVPGVVMTPVLKMDTEELTPEQQEVLPQDIG
jgi:hypothetical protein